MEVGHAGMAMRAPACRVVCAMRPGLSDAVDQIASESVEVSGTADHAGSLYLCTLRRCAPAALRALGTSPRHPIRGRRWTLAEDSAAKGIERRKRD